MFRLASPASFDMIDLVKRLASPTASLSWGNHWSQASLGAAPFWTFSNTVSISLLATPTLFSVTLALSRIVFLVFLLRT